MPVSRTSNGYSAVKTDLEPLGAFQSDSRTFRRLKTEDLNISPGQKDDCDDGVPQIQNCLINFPGSKSDPQSLHTFPGRRVGELEESSRLQKKNKGVFLFTEDSVV